MLEIINNCLKIKRWCDNFKKIKLILHKAKILKKKHEFKKIDYYLDIKIIVH